MNSWSFFTDNPQFINPPQYFHLPKAGRRGLTVFREIVSFLFAESRFETEKFFPGRLAADPGRPREVETGPKQGT